MKLHGRFSAGLVIVFLFTQGATGSALAQEGVILPELPFTTRIGIGARSTGMGFAYGAVAEDGSSLFYNPSGLAQIRRIEISGGLVHDAQNREVGFDTALTDFPGTGQYNNQSATRATQIGHLSLAYPIPTYRGSLVFGFAYQRVVSLRGDYFRDGFLRTEPDTLYESESFSDEGVINYWTVGIAGDISPHISLGATISYIQGNSLQNLEIGRIHVHADGSTDVDEPDTLPDSLSNVLLTRNRLDSDIVGVTGSIGILAHASDRVRLGLTVDLPQKYEFDGISSEYIEDKEKFDCAGYFFSDIDCRNPGLFHDVITLPMSFLGSVAFTSKNLLLSGDLRLTDWTQIDFNGPITRNRESAYRSTVDVSIGAEYQLPFHPTRVRAGFSRQPLPYKFIPSNLTVKFVPDDGDNDTTSDTSYFLRDYPNADIKNERSFLTLGVGTLIDETMTIDLAYVHGMYDRRGDSISEKWTTNRVFGTATFRF